MDLLNRELEVRASKGVVYEYVNMPSGESQPQPDPVDLLHDLIDNDNVLASAFDATVDVMTMNGFSFVGKNERAIKEAERVFEDELDFDNELDNLLHNMLLGDAYLEFVSGEKGDREVHSLESREIEMKYDVHGEILGYIQKPRTSDAPDATWSREEVIHFPMKQVGSRVYSQNPNKSILSPLRVKRKASKYLESIFDNFPPKLMYILKSANKAQSDAFIKQLQSIKFDPSRDVVAYGDTDVKQTGLGLFDDGLIKILEYLRKEIAMITRIPPSWLGIREAGGRSTGEIETLAFFSKIKKLHKKIASKINKELMPKLGLVGVKFKFNPISLLDEKTAVEVARNLREMNLEDDAVLHYLHEKCIQIPSNAEFKEEKEPEGEMESPITKSKDLMESRRRTGNSNDPRKSNLNEQGVSEESGKKMREQQVRSASLPDSSKHWEFNAIT